MTPEEKARAYDEALEKARKIHNEILNNEILGFPDQIREIFPQLRESEDDRMMRVIGLALTDVPEERFTSLGTTLKDCLAYLEKQKEQNDEDEECTDFTIYHPLKNGKGKYECIPYSFWGSLTSFSEDKDLIDFLRTCFYTKEECNEWIEQQQEQKPVVSLDTMLSKDPHLPKQAIKDKQKPTDYCSVRDEFDLDGNLKQKPADKEQDSIAFLEQHGYTIVPPHAPVSIVPSSEATFTKWSEEDENELAIIISVIEDAKADAVKQYPKYKAVHNAYDRMLHFLKSLRPSWKPSGEQMKALKETIDFAPETFKPKCLIESLYECLKKRM